MRKIKRDMIVFLLILLAGIASAASTVPASTSPSIESCSLTVTLLNQEPYPAVPGEYVKVVFQISGLNDNACSGAKFRLVPKYPFSLDEGDEIKVLDGNTYIPGYNKNWLIGYKLRVDKDAVEGENSIEARYTSNTNLNFDSYVEKSFNITIEDSRTSFDAVVQDFSDNQISIALANVGEKTANAAVARIPQQKGYRILGTDGQMIGNLESGDYTIVSFEIAPTTIGRSQDVPLEFQIDYTDSIGERRSVPMNLTLNMNAIANTNATFTGMARSRMQQQSSSTISTTTWIIIAIIALVILVILYMKRRWILGLFKKSPKKSHENMPDWMKNNNK